MRLSPVFTYSLSCNAVAKNALITAELIKRSPDDFRESGAGAMFAFPVVVSSGGSSSSSS